MIRVEEVKGGGWKVVIRDWNEGTEGKEVEESWDAVVIAIEGYDNSVWLKTDRLEEVRRRGLARHAKWWQGIEGCEGKVSRRPFRDGDFTVHIYCKRLLVVGNKLETQVVMNCHHLVH